MVTDDDDRWWRWWWFCYYEHLFTKAYANPNPGKTVHLVAFQNSYRRIWSSKMMFLGIAWSTYTQVDKLNRHIVWSPFPWPFNLRGRGVAAERGGWFSGPNAKPDTNGQPYLFPELNFGSDAMNNPWKSHPAKTMLIITFYAPQSGNVLYNVNQ